MQLPTPFPIPREEITIALSTKDPLKSMQYYVGK